jgi:hypothetical protein
MVVLMVVLMVIVTVILTVMVMVIILVMMMIVMVIAMETMTLAGWMAERTMAAKATVCRTLDSRLNKRGRLDTILVGRSRDLWWRELGHTRTVLADVAGCCCCMPMQK